MRKRIIRKDTEGLLLFFASASSFAGLLSPESRALLGTWVKASFSPDSVYWIFQREPYLCLLGIGFLFLAIRNIRASNIPIRVLETKLEIYFDNLDESLARVHRFQILRANQPGVDTYITNIRPDAPNGRAQIDPLTWRFEGVKSKATRILGNDRRGWEIIQQAVAPLPYPWWSPFVPSALLLLAGKYLPKPLRNLLVHRVGDVTYIDEYSDPEKYLEFYTARYPQRRVTIDLHFQPKRVPRGFDSIDVMRTRAQGGGSIDDEKITEHLDSESRKVGYRIEFEPHPDERVRITWSSPQIDEPRDPLMLEARTPGVLIAEPEISDSTQGSNEPSDGI